MDRTTLETRARAAWRAAWLRLFPAHFLLHAAAAPRELGLAGERLIARRLSRRGFRVLARRLATRAAEVDILAERAGELWLVEVKTGRLARPRRPDSAPRWDPRGLPGRHLGARQRARLESAARALLQSSTDHTAARILLAEVRLDPLARVLECRIHPEAGGKVHRETPGCRSS
jgi:Holliday junction resolvase-like predicted endonuclease